VKLKDVTIKSWGHLYNHAHFLMNRKGQDHQDLVHSAWEELVAQDKEYDNEAHAIFFFKLRIKDLCFDLFKNRGKEVRHILESMKIQKYTDDSDQKRVELNHDIAKIVRYLDKKGKRYGAIFKAMLDVGEYGNQKIVAQELGISETNLKVQYMAVKAHAQDFVENIYNKPTRKYDSNCKSRTKELRFQKKFDNN